MTEIDAVRNWLHLVAQLETPLGTGLSSHNEKAALLKSIKEMIARWPPDVHRDLGGRDVRVIQPRHVFTAALDWLAVYLYRGAKVTVKAPRSLSKYFEAIASSARDCALPLEVSYDRMDSIDADLVIVMGADETIEQLSGYSGISQFAGFGRRFSVAWIDAAALNDASIVSKLALDIALYDGRGCMSPSAYFSDSEECVDVLKSAMDIAQRTLPLGEISIEERHFSRMRRLLAKARGERVHELCCDGIPTFFNVTTSDNFEPLQLPRSFGVVQVASVDEFCKYVHQQKERIECVALSDSNAYELPSCIRATTYGDMHQSLIGLKKDGINWMDL